MELTEEQQAARATWEAGNFDAVADRIWAVGGDLVERVGVTAGDLVLDVACGTGNATIPAAQAGGQTTGLDIAPSLLEDGRRRAEAAGVEVDWVEGDAEDLPFDDASFDVVLSTFGCMFAPDHQRAAAEIARVIRPGGRMGIAAWTPEGSIGRFFKATSEFAPPRPEGFQPPPLWGARDHVEELFAGTGMEPEFTTTTVEFRFDSVDHAVELMTTNFGPLVMLRKAIEPQGRWDEFLEVLRAQYEEDNTSGGAEVVYPGEYLVIQGTKRG